MPLSLTPSSPTYLNVPYAEKDQAKALGARWDPARRSWYAPGGLDPLIFDAWLSAATRAELQTQKAETRASSAGVEVTPLQGIGLAELLRGVAQIVASSFDQPVWTRVEVLRVHLSANGHVYLELTERNTVGQVLAKARGTLWSRVANQILPEFEQATGVQLAPGIQLLVLTQPQFKAEHGFSLNISGIDPSYTLGRLEAHKRQIRQALKAEGITERNRQLPTPWDFFRVMVLSPKGAAGLDDFVSDARLLQQYGVCEFIYLHSRFQGEGAAAEMLRTLQSALEAQDAETFDAIIIIRGGGAVNDLAWLNDLALARFICLSPTPVLTGIGHERDSTILDEVAHHSYDTPSKVIAGIRQRIRERTTEATDYFSEVFYESKEMLRQSVLSARQYVDQIREAAKQTLNDADHGSTREVNMIRVAAIEAVHRARGACREFVAAIRADTRSQLRLARQSAPASMIRIQDAAQANLKQARTELRGTLPFVLRDAQEQVAQARETSIAFRDAVFERSHTAVQRLRTESEGLMREIAGQGPQKTLNRGFAIVRDNQGQPLMSASTTKLAGSLQLQFTDGKIAAQVTQTSYKPTDTAPPPED